MGHHFLENLTLNFLPMRKIQSFLVFVLCLLSLSGIAGTIGSYPAASVLNGTDDFIIERGPGTANYSVPWSLIQGYLGGQPPTSNLTNWSGLNTNTMLRAPGSSVSGNVVAFGAQSYLSLDSGISASALMYNGMNSDSTINGNVTLLTLQASTVKSGHWQLRTNNIPGSILDMSLNVADTDFGTAAPFFLTNGQFLARGITNNGNFTNTGVFSSDGNNFFSDGSSGNVTANSFSASSFLGAGTNVLAYAQVGGIQGAAVVEGSRSNRLAYANNVVMNVLLAGALGGANDDTAAIQAMIVPGVTLRFPATNYTISSLNLTNNIQLYGYGAHINMKFGATITNEALFSQVPRLTNILIEGFTLDGGSYATNNAFAGGVNGGSTNRQAISLDVNSRGCIYRDLIIQGFDRGFNVYGTNNGSFTVFELGNPFIENNELLSNYFGIYAVSTNSANVVEYFDLTQNHVHDNTIGFWIGGGNIGIVNNKIEENFDGIIIDGVGSNPGHSIIANNSINHNGGPGGTGNGNAIIVQNIAVTKGEDIYGNTFFADSQILFSNAIGNSFHHNLGINFGIVDGVSGVSGSTKGPNFVYNNLYTGNWSAQGGNGMFIIDWQAANASQPFDQTTNIEHWGNFSTTVLGDADGYGVNPYTHVTNYNITSFNSTNIGITIVSNGANSTATWSFGLNVAGSWDIFDTGAGHTVAIRDATGGMYEEDQSNTQIHHQRHYAAGNNNDWSDVYLTGGIYTSSATYGSVDSLTRINQGAPANIAAPYIAASAASMIDFPPYGPDIWAAQPHPWMGVFTDYNDTGNPTYNGGSFPIYTNIVNVAKWFHTNSTWTNYFLAAGIQATIWGDQGWNTNRDGNGLLQWRADILTKNGASSGSNLVAMINTNQVKLGLHLYRDLQMWNMYNGDTERVFQGNTYYAYPSGGFSGGSPLWSVMTPDTIRRDIDWFYSNQIPKIIIAENGLLSQPLEQQMAAFDWAVLYPDDNEGHLYWKNIANNGSYFSGDAGTAIPSVYTLPISNQLVVCGFMDKPSIRFPFMVNNYVGDQGSSEPLPSGADNGLTNAILEFHTLMVEATNWPAHGALGEFTQYDGNNSAWTMANISNSLPFGLMGHFNMYYQVDTNKWSFNTNILMASTMPIYLSCWMDNTLAQPVRIFDDHTNALWVRPMDNGAFLVLAWNATSATTTNISQGITNNPAGGTSYGLLPANEVFTATNVENNTAFNGGLVTNFYTNALAGSSQSFVYLKPLRFAVTNAGTVYYTGPLFSVPSP
jgi:hypothetical protein